MKTTLLYDQEVDAGWRSKRRGYFYSIIFELSPALGIAKQTDFNELRYRSTIS